MVGGGDLLRYGESWRGSPCHGGGEGWGRRPLLPSTHGVEWSLAVSNRFSPSEGKLFGFRKRE